MVNFKLFNVATQQLEIANLRHMTRAAKEQGNTRVYFDNGIGVLYKIDFGIFNAMCDRFIGPSIHERMLERDDAA